MYIIILFLIIYFSFYYLHINFFEIDVLLYSAVFDSLLATIVLSTLIFFKLVATSLSILEKFLISTICFLIGYSIAITIPTLIDRSLSLYLLEKIEQKGGQINYEKFEILFVEEYIKEHSLVDIRITEQLESGTIKVTNKCVTLTDRGLKIVAFSKFFRKYLLPKKRLVANEFTAKLTEPYKNITHHDYSCQKL